MQGRLGTRQGVFCSRAVTSRAFAWRVSLLAPRRRRWAHGDPMHPRRQTPCTTEVEAPAPWIRPGRSLCKIMLSPPSRNAWDSIPLPDGSPAATLRVPAFVTHLSIAAIFHLRLLAAENGVSSQAVRKSSGVCRRCEGYASPCKCAWPMAGCRILIAPNSAQSAPCLKNSGDRIQITQHLTEDFTDRRGKSSMRPPDRPHWHGGARAHLSPRLGPVCVHT